MKKIIFLMLFALVSWEHALAQTFTSDGLIYNVTSSNTAEVGNQNGAATGTITIPSQVTNDSIVYSVTSIGVEAFQSCSALTSVTIPDTVTSIGYAAFVNCPGLTSITIGNSVTSINAYAFSYCIGLTSVTIPNSLTNIGFAAFNGCSGLTSVTIGNSVTNIGDYAFNGCSGLTSIICNVSAPITINSTVFGFVNQDACILEVPASAVTAYQAAAVWQNFATIVSNPTYNTSAVSACGSYNWLINNQTYLTSGNYIYVSTNDGIYYTVEKLVLTLQSNFTIDGINYLSTSSTTVAVGDNTNTTGVVVIPASITTSCGTYAVTSIGQYAFAYCTSLTSVTIPNSVTSIGLAAFGLTGLTSVTIPNSVTNIEQYAFAYCSNLTSVICNASVPITIDASVFEGVNQSGCILVVTAGTIATYEAAGVWQDFGLVVSNPTFTNTTTISACNSYTWLVNNQTYTTSGTYYYASTNDGTNYNVETLALTLQSNFTIDGINYVVTSPTTVEVVINSGATGVVAIPAAVTTACGTYAVTSIGENAFNDCPGLTSVTIPNSVTSIGFNAFAYCSGLTSVTIPNSVMSIGEYAFEDCTSLTSVTIPNSVTGIGTNAFANCSGLTTVTLPNAITSISEGVFRSCSQLPSISIPNSVTSIGEYVFYGCSGLTSVSISNSLTNIGNYAFDNCTGLTLVTIPNTVTSIGISAFFGCGGLTSITIPNSVTSIGNGAFQNCNNLTSVNISNSIMSIADSTFAGCTGLTSVTIPNSVTSIGDSAFNTCTGLTSITIENSVTSIGQRAFANCFSLTSVICNVSTPMTITANVFADVNQGTCSLAVPAASLAAYQAAAVWKNFNPIISATTTVFNTTTESACGSYTWANNNVTYTTTGVYTGTTTNGITEQLDLTITNTTQPTASAQTFHGSKTVADLVATGTALKWYDVATNGTALASTTVIATGTYYVSQTLNSCESDRTPLSVTVTPISIPDAPTNLEVIPFSTGGTIQFTAPASDGGSAITNYEYSTDNGATWVTPSPAITSSPLNISSGLTNCTSYQIKIRAVNAAGSGTASAAAQLIPATSVDMGVNWTERTSAADNNWQSVAYGNGLFVAVAATGSGNRVMTSPDGITWTPRSSAVDNDWKSVTYGNGLFVAVAASGSGNRVMTSPDGITWTIRTSAADYNWSCVTFGNGLFVAVASTGYNKLMTSPDGITWTIGTVLWSPMLSVTYGNGLFVAVSINNTRAPVLSSSDGITWTEIVIKSLITSITYGNGLFIVVTRYGTGNRVMTSPDGITWTARTSAADNDWQSVTFGNGLFVAVANSGAGNRVMTSANGINWTARTSAADNSWSNVTYGNGVFVAVASSGTGNRVMTSSYSSAADAPVITSATYGSTSTVNFTQSSSSFTPSSSNYEYSADNGSTWTAVSPAATTSPITITGLSDGANSIMLRAVNSVGNSCPSNRYDTQLSVLNKNGGFTSDPLQAVDKYGAKGSGKGLSQFGGVIDVP